MIRSHLRAFILGVFLVLMTWETPAQETTDATPGTPATRDHNRPGTRTTFFSGVDPHRRTVTTESAHTILEISDPVIAGEIPLQQEKWASAAELLERAARIGGLDWGAQSSCAQRCSYSVSPVSASQAFSRLPDRSFPSGESKWSHICSEDVSSHDPAQRFELRGRVK